MSRTYDTVTNTIRLPQKLNAARERVGLTWNEAVALGVALAAAQHDDMVAAHGPQDGYAKYREWVEVFTGGQTAASVTQS